MNLKLKVKNDDVTIGRFTIQKIDELDDVFKALKEKFK